MSASFGGTITGGIQDVSALLPLLGTDQCDKHVGSSLEGGYLYAAATPLSIFGSLGIVKAGISILVASISIPKPTLTFTPLPKLSFTSGQCWLGGRVLSNAGIEISGKVAPLIGMDEKRFKAETRLLQILEEKHIDKPENLSVEWTSRQWNIGLVIFSSIAAALSLVPYIDLTLNGADSVHSLWTFPLIRAAGSCIGVVCCQFIIQSRIISLMKNRIIFMIMNQFLLDELKKQNPDGMNSEPILQLQHQEDFKWDDTLPAEECLWSLEQYLRKQVPTVCPELGEEKTQAPPPGLPPNASIVSLFGSEIANNGSEIDQSSHLPLQIELPNHERILERLNELRKEHFPNSTIGRLYIIFSCILLLLAIPAVTIGYVGCFTLVQATDSTNSKGPLIWLGLEAALSVIRILLWASNPSFDEKTEVTMQLKLSEHAPLVTTEKDDDVISSTGNNILDLVPQREFLEHITPFTGPLEQFNGPENTVLYFTLSGNRRDDTVHLYIIVFDLSNRTAFTLHHDPHKREILYVGATMEPDVSTGEIQATLQEPINKDCHRWKNNITLFDSLPTYYSSLLHALNRAKSDIVDTPNQGIHPTAARTRSQSHIDPTVARLRWKWSLLPHPTNFENQRQISDVPSPPLTEYNRLYLQRGYEHHLKTKLIEKWGEWISDGMGAINGYAQNDRHHASADPTSTKAKWELFGLEITLLREWVIRERTLIEVSIKLEEILYSRMVDYIKKVIEERSERRVEEWLRSEFAIGLKKRLEREQKGAMARMEEMRKASADRAEREGLPGDDQRELKEITQHWMDDFQTQCAKAIDGGVDGLKDWVPWHTRDDETDDESDARCDDREDEEDKEAFVKKVMSRFARWESQRKYEQQAMDDTIERISKAESFELLEQAYRYPDFSSELAGMIYLRFSDLGWLSPEKRAFAAKLSSATVYDVWHCDSDVVRDVIKKSSTRSVIKLSRALIPVARELIGIPENDHLLYLGSDEGEEVALSFIQRNRDRWWTRQTTNSATFYFSPPSVDLHGRYVWQSSGTIAHIMIFIQEPTRVRLRLSHFQEGQVSVSIQEQGNELRLIHPEEIGERGPELQDFELGLFEEGRHQLELVSTLTDEGFYAIRDIIVKFISDSPSHPPHDNSDANLVSEEEREGADESGHEIERVEEQSERSET